MSAMVTPSKEAISSLYHNMLRTSRTFTSYNFRKYFAQRTKDTVRTLQNETNEERLRSLYADALREHEVLRRSAAMNQLYGGWKVSLEMQEPEKEAEVDKEGSDS